MTNLRKFTKRLSIGAASLMLIAPLALSSISASANNNNQNNQQISDLVAMNLSKKQQKNHGLNTNSNNPQYTKPQLNYVYKSTYNQVHQSPISAKSAQERANKMTKMQIENTLARLLARITNCQIPILPQRIEQDQNVPKQARPNKQLAKHPFNGTPPLAKRHYMDAPPLAKHHYMGTPPLPSKKAQERVINRSHDNASSYAQFIQQRANYRYPQIEKNFRDLGGYKTRDGRYVKTGKIYRSNWLRGRHSSNMSRRQYNAFRKAHVGLSIDLRDDYQRAHRPDDSRVNEVNDPIFSNLDVTALHQYAKSHHLNSFQMQKYAYGHMLANSKRSNLGYRRVFYYLLRNHKGAIVYHCIDGRDRTGIASILILNALGVPKSTAIKDYLLSNTYEHNMPLGEQYALIQSFYSAVDHKYGSVHKYLNKGVHLSNPQIHKLQQMYLTK